MSPEKKLAPVTLKIFYKYDMRISAPPILEFDVARSQFDVAWGHFDVAWPKLWLKNDVFDEIFGCVGHLK